MKKILLIGAVLLIHIQLHGQQNDPFTIYDYFRLKTVVDIAPSPDGKYLAFTVNRNRAMEEGKGNDYRELHVKNLESGEETALLTEKHYLTSLSWTPDSKTITFLAKFDKAVKNQVFGMDIGSKEYRQMTNIPNGIRQYAWHPAGKGIAFTSTQQISNPNEELEDIGFDAEVFEENIPAINLFWQNENRITKLNTRGTVFDFAWSPAGERIAAQVAPLNLVDHRYMFKDIYLIDVEAGTMELWVDIPGKLGHMAWSPDGKRIAFNAGVDISDPVDGSLFAAETDESHEWLDIRNYTDGFEGSVTHVDWIDKKTMIFAAEESVDATLSRIRVNRKNRDLLTGGDAPVFTSFEKAGNRLFLIADRATHPNEAYSFDPETQAFTRETGTNLWLEERAFGRQEKVSYQARDGLRIDGVLIFPVDYEEGRRYPLICVIHGGPESAILNGWSTSYSRWGQIAAGQDYFVFMPNYRASSGRGVEFSKMDQADLGDEEFLDVIDGINHLDGLEYIDKSKVGIGGGSYGGYFSALGATQYSEHFAAAVPFVAVTNQLSKVNLTDIPYEIYYVHWTMWPNEDPMLFYDRSPVKYSSGSNTPTLILHGKEDTRVHPSQALELYRQLKLHGNAPVRLVWYPGEGHGNRNNQAQLDFNLRTMRWFNHYLKGEGDPSQLPPDHLDYRLEKLYDLDQ